MKRRMQTQYDLLSPYSKRIRESKAAISRKGAKKKILDQCRQLGMSEILDSVWIGDSSSADKVLESEGNTLGLGFTHLLDLRINTNSRSAREKKGLFLKPMDEEGESILMNEGSALNHHCLDFVDEIKKSAEGKALICCNTGNNASIAVLVAYMITRLRFKVLSSLRYIHAKRPTIWPEPYISQLVSLEDVMLLDCNEEPMTMKPHSSMNEPPPILGSRTDFLNQPPPILSPLPPILSSKLTTLDSISESSNGNMVPCKGTLSQSSMEKQSFDRLKQMVERIRHSLLHVDKIEGIGFGTLADFDEIAKNVYLGDKWAGRQSVLGEEGPCSKLGITHVIDASDNSLYSSDTKLHKVKWLKLNLDDDGFTDITENDFKLLKTAFSFIDEALTKSGKILIHCSAGVNRSTTIYTGNQCSIFLF